MITRPGVGPDRPQQPSYSVHEKSGERIIGKVGAIIDCILRYLPLVAAWTNRRGVIRGISEHKVRDHYLCDNRVYYGNK